MTTADLPHLNPFTVGQLVPVLPFIGIKDDEPIYQVCAERVRHWLTSSGIGIDPFPPNGYLTYWILVSARRIGISDIDSSPLVDWSRTEFYRQVGLLSANDDEEGDAFQLAYNLIIQIAFSSEPVRPGVVQHALKLLASQQLTKGLWEKKEPLFVWGSGGDAYCFSFELLDSLLHELGPGFDYPFEMWEAFRTSLSWAVRNAHNEGALGVLWRSGHMSHTHSPESWATSVVYSFLRGYAKSLSSVINSELIANYGGAVHGPPKPAAFLAFYQPPMRLLAGRNEPSEVPKLLLDTLRVNFLDELAMSDRYSLSDHPRRRHLKRSAILFGPPGTGKSSYVRAMAEYLGWPLIVLDPSHFAAHGLAVMASTVASVFRDLGQSRDVVIFLDEMEEFMLDRGDDGGNASFEQRLLTTVLLPKLQALHDGAQCLFFVATNHFDKLDPAVRRFGRFDATLEVLPAALDEKCRHIAEFLRGRVSTPEGAPVDSAVIDQAVSAAVESLRGSDRLERLEWATYGEMLSLLSAVEDAISTDVSAGRDPARDHRLIADHLMAKVSRFPIALEPSEWESGRKFTRIG